MNWTGHTSVVRDGGMDPGVKQVGRQVCAQTEKKELDGARGQLRIALELRLDGGSTSLLCLLLGTHANAHVGGGVWGRWYIPKRERERERRQRCRV